MYLRKIGLLSLHLKGQCQCLCVRGNRVINLSLRLLDKNSSVQYNTTVLELLLITCLFFSRQNVMSLCNSMMVILSLSEMVNDCIVLA